MTKEDLETIRVALEKQVPPDKVYAVLLDVVEAMIEQGILGYRKSEGAIYWDGSGENLEYYSER